MIRPAYDDFIDRSEYLDAVNDYADYLEVILKEYQNSSLVCKCPYCSTEMKGIVLTHYKCSKCKQYYTD